MCQDLSVLYCLYYLVYELESASVCRLDHLFVGEIKVTLSIGGCLLCSAEGSGRLNHLTKSLGRGGDRVDHGTAELFGKLCRVNGVFFFLLTSALFSATTTGIPSSRS